MAAEEAPVPELAADLVTGGTRFPIIRSMYDDILNEGSLEMLGDVIAADAVDHASQATSSLPISSSANFTDFLETFCLAFPDAYWTVEEIVDCGDIVEIHTVLTGTHHGEIFGIRPRGRELELHGIDRVCIRGGKITDHWGELDIRAIVAQLDIVETPQGSLDGRSPES